MSNYPLLLCVKQTWEGEWWLPDNPENRLVGALNYDGEGGLILSLAGTFDFEVGASGNCRVFFGEKEWSVIYGRSGQCNITLLETNTDTRALLSKGSQNTFKNPCCPVVANYAIIGAHVNGGYDEVFNMAEFSFEGLRQWAGGAAFGMPLGEGGCECAGEVRNDNGVWYNLLRTSLNFTDNSSSVKASESELEVFLRVTSKKLFTLDDVFMELDMFHDLVALATTSRAGVTWLRLGLSEVGTSSSGESKRAYLLYHPVAFACRDADKINANQILFTCGSLPFEKTLRKWLQIYEENKAAIRIILGVIYDSDKFVEDKILASACAAEVLHGGLKLGGEPFSDKKEFKRMREKILKVVPEECKSWVKERIRNQPSLRERLYGLINRLEENVVKQFALDLDKDLWVRQTVKARNDFTHQGETPGQTLIELDAIARVTTMVVIFNLLKELGVLTEQQLKVIGQHSEVKKASRLARKYLKKSQPDSGKSDADTKS